VNVQSAARSTASAAPARRRSPGFWRETWTRFRRQWLASAALAYIVGLGLVALFAPAIVGAKPIICSYKGHLYFPCLGYFRSEWENPIFQRDGFRKEYTPKRFHAKDPQSWQLWPLVHQDPYRRVRADEWPGQPPNPTHEEGKPNRFNLFGTDEDGVDVFAQMVHGTTIAILVGFVSMGIAATLGILLGAIGGFAGGLVDMLISRLTEVVLCVPTLVLILALLAVVEHPSIWHMMIVIGCTSWTSIARLTRAEVLRLKQMDFVAAARALGLGGFRIVFRHILPNALTPVLVPIAFGVASAILIEASLSFLGFGSPPPNPSWGTLLNKGRQDTLWWLIFFPGTAIFLVVLAYNLIGEGLQRAIDPHLRKSEA
jgi:peptide/nickel transport system permease protein